MTTETTPSNTPDDDRTFSDFLEFLSHLDEQTLVRLLIDPAEPLRGQDSIEAGVQDIHAIDTDGNELSEDELSDGEKVATRYVFSADEMFEGDLPDNYTCETVLYRFSVPDSNTLNKTDIEIEKNYTPYQADDGWQAAGYLVGGGVMIYYH